MENTTMNLDSIIAALVAQYITPIIKAQIAEQMDVVRPELEADLEDWGDKKLRFLTNHVEKTIAEAAQDFVSDAIDGYDFSNHVVEAVNSTLAKSLRKMANEL